MALLAADGRVIAMNPATRALLTDDREVVGQPFARLPWWGTETADSSANLEQGLEQCRQGQTYRFTPSIERDGATVKLDVSMRPISRAGDVFSILATAQPIDA